MYIFFMEKEEVLVVKEKEGTFTKTPGTPLLGIRL
jgi:hypothetical protein